MKGQPLFFTWKMNNKWIEDQHSSLLMNTYLSPNWWIETLNVFIFPTWEDIPLIITTRCTVLLMQYNIWKSFMHCLVLQQNEHACNELTTRGTTIFKSLSNYLHLLIIRSTTHQDTFTFDLIWSRKSPY